MKKLLTPKSWLSGLLLGILVPLGALGQSASPVGVWADEDGDSHIEIFACNPQQLCGKLVWLRPASDSTATAPTLDTRNPDEAKRTQPLLNLRILQGLRYDSDDQRWEDGEIYDPRNGRTYSCYLRLLSKNQLEVKGYIGFSFIGRSHYWTRVR
jgi:uncharacterized protein (DUF2147 family)